LIEAIDHNLSEISRMAKDILPVGFKIMDIAYSATPNSLFYPPQGYSISIGIGHGQKYRHGVSFLRIPSSEDLRKAINSIIRVLLNRKNREIEGWIDD